MDIEVEDTNVPVKTMTRKHLHDIIRGSSERLLDNKFKYLEDEVLKITKCPSDQLGALRKKLSNFKAEYKRKWISCNSTEARFREKHEQWLSGNISLPACGTYSGGRPSKEFGESCDRSKRRKTIELRTNVPADELTYAAQMSHRAAGKSDMANVINEIMKSPGRAKKVRQAVSSSRKTTRTEKHSPSQALAIFVEADLTMKQYDVIHQANKNIYPCYSELQKAKQQCYPKAIFVNETRAEINLQELLDHTSIRLCEYLKEVIETCSAEEKKNMELIYKWGCDGSQQSQYKQKFKSDGASDSHIFQSSIVPLRLSSGQKILWKNPVPSSPRYCRPIRIRFIKENNDVTNEEIEHIENQAKNLRKTEVEGENIFICHILLPTMVDGKECNAATKTASTIRCYICGETSSTFNKINVRKEENPETFRFGLSTLHARIRFFEFLLHLSYKIKAEVYISRVTGDADKKKISEKKKIIQDEFKAKMGLLVDMPKANFGNTNDGNTSRRFFSEPDLAAKITGIIPELIHRFKVILEVISSGFDVHIKKFEKYTMETAEFYVRHYDWQPMSPTVHKILIHGPSVIAHALLPIGQLSEEAAEARNKHFRQYRQNFARKFSREKCNRDILNRLLLTSDPYLTSIRPKPMKKMQAFSKDAIALFQQEQFSQSTESDHNEEEGNDEDD